MTALLGSAFAQSSTSTGTATAAGATHSIAVGAVCEAGPRELIITGRQTLMVMDL